MKIIKKNPLYFAFLFPALVDGTLTLFGQDSSYWRGGRVNEASPVYYLLNYSPVLFVAGSIFWFVFWYWMFKKLKEPINFIFMFLFIAGHSWGSSTWIWHIAGKNRLYSLTNQPSVIFIWFIAILYFAVISLFATYCLRIYLREKN